MSLILGTQFLMNWKVELTGKQTKLQNGGFRTQFYIYTWILATVPFPINVTPLNDVNNEM